MTRPIKFRGMDANGVMRYGRLSQDKPDTTVYYSQYSQRICWDNSNIPVSNESLGQFTGLLDAKGREIYEGDVVKRKVGCGYTKEMVAHVVYDDGSAMYFLQTPAGGHEVGGNLEVIGNVYEKPNLLT